jgi:hypothetical protein
LFDSVFNGGANRFQRFRRLRVVSELRFAQRSG